MSTPKLSTVSGERGTGSGRIFGISGRRPRDLHPSFHKCHGDLFPSLDDGWKSHCMTSSSNTC